MTTQSGRHSGIISTCGRWFVIVMALSVSTTMVSQAAGATTSPPPPALQGSGSALAALPTQQWTQDESLAGLNVSYAASNSAKGLMDFANGHTDFAGSDLSFADGGVSPPNTPYQYIPDFGYAEGFLYNIVGTNGQKITNLILNGRAIAQIFTGAITTWNAPAIVALNPQLAGILPGTKIETVFQAGSSEVTELLTKYLINQDRPLFNSYLGAIGDSNLQAVATWPLPTSSSVPGFPAWGLHEQVAFAGPDQTAEVVSSPSSTGAIAYAPAMYGTIYGDPVASIVNTSGMAVQPTAVNVSTALSQTTHSSDLGAILAGGFRAPEANAYPVSSYSYVVAPCSPILARHESPPTQCSGSNSKLSSYPVSEGEELGAFINHVVCGGQIYMSQLGFAALPPSLVADAFAAVGRINGASEPSAPTASNCPNPYVDGQFSLP